MALPSHSETERYLRRTLEIPPQLPVNLSILPYAEGQKLPPVTLMIKLAIWGSKHKMLTIQGIFNEVEMRYPSLKDLPDKPWQRSIRHNLSLKSMFVQVENSHYWTIDIRNGEGDTRGRNKRRDSGESSSSESSSSLPSDEDGVRPEDVDEYRSFSAGFQSQGAPQMPSNQTEQYAAMVSSIRSSIQTSGMGYQPNLATSSSGRSDELPAHPRGISVTSNHPFYMPTYGPDGTIQLPFAPYMQGQMSPHMASSMTGRQQMPTLDPALYGQGAGLRRFAPDETQDNRREPRRRTRD